MAIAWRAATGLFQSPTLVSAETTTPIHRPCPSRCELPARWEPGPEITGRSKPGKGVSGRVPEGHPAPRRSERWPPAGGRGPGRLPVICLCLQEPRGRAVPGKASTAAPALGREAQPASGHTDRPPRGARTAVTPGLLICCGSALSNGPATCGLWAEINGVRLRLPADSALGFLLSRQ